MAQNGEGVVVMAVDFGKHSKLTAVWWLDPCTLCERPQSGLICVKSAVYEVLFNCEYMYSCDTCANISWGGNRTFENQRAATWDNMSQFSCYFISQALMHISDRFLTYSFKEREQCSFIFMFKAIIISRTPSSTPFFLWTCHKAFALSRLAKQTKQPLQWKMEKYPVKSWKCIWPIHFAIPCNDNDYKSSQTLWSLLIQHKQVT